MDLSKNVILTLDETVIHNHNTCMSTNPEHFHLQFAFVLATSYY